LLKLEVPIHCCCCAWFITYNYTCNKSYLAVDPNRKHTLSGNSK